ncbi:hypothetical protein SSX86_024544 [Deinandra increscens subsp. villosa]|uniref:Coiled-coil domain-containing protein 22 homolog n=1 Tax=Deinandra increscens subsp. villosa TaxID=3103831 RepID=A0AAP0GQQ3_9ASTR
MDPRNIEDDDGNKTTWSPEVSVCNRGETERLMEESQEILLNSLAKVGVPIPPEVSSVENLTPEALVSICAHSLRIISNSESIPITLPESMADRFKVCTDLASSVKDLGYIGDMNFHKKQNISLPYGSFCIHLKRIYVKVDKISGLEALCESSVCNCVEAHESDSTIRNWKGARIKVLQFMSICILEVIIVYQFDEFYWRNWIHLFFVIVMKLFLETEYISSLRQFLYPSEEDMYKLIRFLVGRLSESSRAAVAPETKDDNATAMINVDDLERSNENADHEGHDLHTKVEVLKLRTDDGDEDGPHKLEQSTICLQDKFSQTSDKTEFSINQENVFSDDMMEKSLMLQQLEEQHDLLKAATEMAYDEQTPLESYITQLSKQIDAKRHNLAEMESKWEETIKPLHEKTRNFEEAESQEKYQQLKKLEQDLESTLSETNQREKELFNLSAEVEKLPKLATRRSYIERIKEITKNSRKQDIDIERIIKDTRDLQLESNMIQERLHRTYAVVDETLLRGAKKDQVGEQAHILLTTIHESFQEILEKILATDRTRREETDLETKLSSIATRSLNMDKLQADLDAIRKENEYLESRLGNP